MTEEKPHVKIEGMKVNAQGILGEMRWTRLYEKNVELSKG